MLVSKFLNICQTSLLRDISLVKENYNNFCKFYDKTNFYIICPDQQISEFRNNLSKMKIDKGLDLQECELDIYKNYRGRWSKK